LRARKGRGSAAHPCPPPGDPLASMPKPFRSCLLALAFAVSAFACATVTPGPADAGSSALARKAGPLRLPIEKRRPRGHVRHRKRTLGDPAARISLKGGRP